MHALLQLVESGMIDPDTKPIKEAIVKRKQKSISTSQQPQVSTPPSVSSPVVNGAPRANGSHHAVPQQANNAQPQAPPFISQNPKGPALVASAANISMSREFMDWYCKKFGFGRPDLVYKGTVLPTAKTLQWEAILSVNKKSVGLGKGSSKKTASEKAYLDSCTWLADCDPGLWQQYLLVQQQAKEAEAKRDLIVKAFPRADFTPSLDFKFSDRLDERLRDIVWDLRNSVLYKEARLLIADQEEKIKAVRKARAAKRAESILAPATVNSTDASQEASGSSYTYARDVSAKSSQLRVRLLDYRDNPRHRKMRDTRASLPVYAHSGDFLQAVESNPVVILMAQTGSGKTTQVPQIILDDWIEKGKGGECNVVCTQPRRLAAISVAQRIAAERGEELGESVGYQVRFDSKPPAPDGSILFCTTGLFLKRFQLSSTDTGGQSFLDDVTHVIVDEVHERDIDVDLLCFVLRLRLNELRRAGKPGFKIILM